MWHSLTFFLALIHLHGQKSWCYLLISCHSPLLHLSIWPRAVQLLGAPSLMSWKRLCGFSCATSQSVFLCLGSAFPGLCSTELLGCWWCCKLSLWSGAACDSAVSELSSHPCYSEFSLLLLLCQEPALPEKARNPLALGSREVVPISVLELAWTWTDCDL